MSGLEGPNMSGNGAVVRVTDGTSCGFAPPTRTYAGPEQTIKRAA